jgi:general secretion pathway protein H
MQSAPSARHARGFTLFEMVVVVFIIGVIVSFTTLSVGVSTTRVVQEEVQRLQRLMTLASDESVLQTQELALEVYRNGYRFMQLVQAQQSWSWEPLAEDAVFRPRCLPEGMQIEAEIEGVGASLERVDCAQFSAPPEKEDADKDVATIQKSRLDEDKEPPRIFVLSSGEMTPFELKVSLPDDKTYLRLVGELTGKMTTRTPDDDKQR